MSGWEQLAVLAAGLGAGVLTTTVGVASLASFPVLLAVGLPPVVANTTNTVGIVWGSLSGALGYRAELRQHPRLTATVAATCAVGALGGAGVLLVLPPGVFEAVVPWLVLGTCLLVGVQPVLTRWVRTRLAAAADAPLADRTRMGPLTTASSVLVGVYGGYFGAGSGVMMVAVLGFGLDLELRVVNAVKTVSIAAGNVVATVFFVLLADLDWTAVALLAAGSIPGGYVGARLGRRLPPAVFRTLVVAAGIAAFVVLTR